MTSDDERADWLAFYSATAADLAENRAGRLTAQQRALAAGATKSDAVEMVGLALVLTAVMGGVFWMYATSRHFDASDGLDGTELGLSALMLALPAAALAWAAYTVWIHLRHAGAARVERVAGPVIKQTQRHRQLVLHTLVVGEVSLDVAPRVFDRVKHGASYAIYFVPGSRVVVMLEPL